MEGISIGRVRRGKGREKIERQEEEWRRGRGQTERRVRGGRRGESGARTRWGLKECDGEWIIYRKITKKRKRKREYG